MGFRHKIIEEINKLDVESVLELGCDGKDMPNLVLLRGWYPEMELVGCDNELFLKGHLISEALDIYLDQIDLNKGLGYPDERFDLVFTSGVLMYVKDVSKVLKDMVRVAKKYIIIGEVMDRDYIQLMGPGIDWTVIDIDKDFWPGSSYKYEGKILIGKL